ncbi:Spc97 / Spc98 [Perkinsus olseni]|uniref:Spc97 / Spc98 n=1 Tax=Perkinsus olseni TaxID=32597 RepID=A0A7J6P0M3_PEROL|nr:Spc97 / Spc98 [Perkinsus olseni]
MSSTSSGDRSEEASHLPSVQPPIIGPPTRDFSSLCRSMGSEQPQEAEQVQSRLEQLPIPTPDESIFASNCQELAGGDDELAIRMRKLGELLRLESRQAARLLVVPARLLLCGPDSVTEEPTKDPIVASSLATFCYVACYTPQGSLRQPLPLSLIYLTSLKLMRTYAPGLLAPGFTDDPLTVPFEGLVRFHDPILRSGQGLPGTGTSLMRCSLLSPGCCGTLRSSAKLEDVRTRGGAVLSLSSSLEVDEIFEASASLKAFTPKSVLRALQRTICDGQDPSVKDWSPSVPCLLVGPDDALAASDGLNTGQLCLRPQVLVDVRAPRPRALQPSLRGSMEFDLESAGSAQIATFVNRAIATQRTYAGRELPDGKRGCVMLLLYNGDGSCPRDSALYTVISLLIEAGVPGVALLQGGYAAVAELRGDQPLPSQKEILLGQVSETLSTLQETANESLRLAGERLQGTRTQTATKIDEVRIRLGDVTTTAAANVKTQSDALAATANATFERLRGITADPNSWWGQASSGFKSVATRMQQAVVAQNPERNPDNYPSFELAPLALSRLSDSQVLSIKPLLHIAGLYSKVSTSVEAVLTSVPEPQPEPYHYTLADTIDSVVLEPYRDRICEIEGALLQHDGLLPVTYLYGDASYSIFSGHATTLCPTPPRSELPLGFCLDALGELFFSMLSKWIAFGQVPMVADVFFIAPTSKDYSVVETESASSTAVEIHHHLVPKGIISPSLADKILLCGSAVRVLGLCNIVDDTSTNAENLSRLRQLNVLFDCTETGGFKMTAPGCVRYIEASVERARALLNGWLRGAVSPTLLEHLSAVKGLYLLGDGGFWQTFLEECAELTVARRGNVSEYDLSAGPWQLALAEHFTETSHQANLASLRLLPLGFAYASKPLFNSDTRLDSISSACIAIPLLAPVRLSYTNYVTKQSAGAVPTIDWELACKSSLCLVGTARLGGQGAGELLRLGSSGQCWATNRQLVARGKVLHGNRVYRARIKFDVFQYAEMIKKVSLSTTDFDGIVRAHRAFLADILSKCFLESNARSRKIRLSIEKLSRACTKLAALGKQGIFDDALPNERLGKAIKSLEDKFVVGVRDLISLLDDMHLTSSERAHSLSQLLLRLDYNEVYTSPPHTSINKPSNADTIRAESYVGGDGGSNGAGGRRVHEVGASAVSEGANVSAVHPDNVELQHERSNHIQSGWSTRLNVLNGGVVGSGVLSSEDYGSRRRPGTETSHLEGYDSAAAGILRVPGVPGGAQESVSMDPREIQEEASKTLTTTWWGSWA